MGTIPSRLGGREDKIREGTHLGPISTPVYRDQEEILLDQRRKRERVYKIKGKGKVAQTIPTRKEKESSHHEEKSSPGGGPKRGK